MFKGYGTCFHFTSKTYKSNYTNQKRERVYRQSDLTIVTFSLSFASGSAFNFGSLNKRYVKDKRTEHKNIEIRFKTLFEI